MHGSKLLKIFIYTNFIAIHVEHTYKLYGVSLHINAKYFFKKKAQQHLNCSFFLSLCMMYDKNFKTLALCIHATFERSYSCHIQHY